VSGRVKKIGLFFVEAPIRKNRQNYREVTDARLEIITLSNMAAS